MICKDILSQYNDLKEEIKEIKERIKRIETQMFEIEQEGSVIDNVRGGSGGNQRFRIEGFPYSEYDKKRILLQKNEETLKRLELKSLKALNEIEKFISEIDDSRMRRIISLRFIENMSWNNVARRIGGGNTSETVRKAFYRYIDKK